MPWGKVGSGRRRLKIEVLGTCFLVLSAWFLACGRADYFAKLRTRGGLGSKISYRTLALHGELRGNEENG